MARASCPCFPATGKMPVPLKLENRSALEAIVAFFCDRKRIGIIVTDEKGVGSGHRAATSAKPVSRGTRSSDSANWRNPMQGNTVSTAPLWAGMDASLPWKTNRHSGVCVAHLH